VDLRRGTAVIRRAKGGKGRVVPILPPLLPAIQAEYLRQGRPERGRVCKCSVEWLRRQIIQASKRALRRTVKPHDLRRTYAIWARDAGVPIHLVSLALGHHSVAITEQWYLEADAHQVVDGFKEAFGQVGRRQRKEMEQ